MRTPTTLRPRTVSTATAARLLGIHKASLYRLVHAPVPHLTIGSRIVWPVGPLAAFLLIEPEDIWRDLDAAGDEDDSDAAAS